MDSLEIPSWAQARRRLLYMCISLAACLNCVSGRISAVTDRLHLRSARQPPVAWRGSIPSSIQAVDLSRLEKSAARASARHNSLLNWEVIFKTSGIERQKFLATTSCQHLRGTSPLAATQLFITDVLKRNGWASPTPRWFSPESRCPGEQEGWFSASFLPFFFNCF